MQSDQRDSVEAVLAGYVDRLNAGERVLPEEILFDHPERGDEILERLEIFVGATQGEPESSPEPLGELGDYTLERRIARGGMGVVYEAWQKSMDRRVALKILPAPVAVDDRAFVRFMREAKTAGKLKHAGIVPVYGTGVEADTPYFAMEYVAGETLAQIIERSGREGAEALTPIDPVVIDHAACVRIALAFADVAEALQHAHGRGVVHRDIKPSNLILDLDHDSGSRGSEDSVGLRILDFGLAQLEGQGHDQLTLTGDVVGTPLYMSPEQARRRRVPVDHRTDIYSLGATLYELLTSGPPFRGRDHEETLSQIIEDEPPLPRSLEPGVDAELEVIVLKCLEKRPEDRYGTAEALGQDLRRFARGDPIEARPVATWQRLVRRANRHRVRIAVAASFALLATLAALFAWRLKVSEREALEASYAPTVMRAAREILGGTLVVRLSAGERYTTNPVGSGLLPRDFRRLLSGGDRSEHVAPIIAELETLANAVDRPAARYFLARAHVLAGDETRARENLETLLAAHPEFPPAIVLRDKLENITTPPPDDARALPRWGKAWIRGHAAFLARDPEAADRALTEILTLASLEGEPFVGCALEVRMQRAHTRRAAGRLLAATEDLAGAWAIDRHFTEAAIYLGKTWIELEEPEEAERVFEELYESLPGDEREAAALLISHAYQSRKYRDLARSELWASRVSRTYHARLLGVLAYRKNHYREAAAHFREVLAADPDDALSAALLAWTFVQGEGDQRAGPDWERELAKSLEHARFAAKQAPDWGATRNLLAFVLLASCRGEESRDVLDVENAHDRFEKQGAILLRVVRLRRERRYREMREFLEPFAEEARRDDGLTYSYLHVLLTRAYLGEGDYEKALESTSRALAASPWMSRAHAVRANALVRLGRYEEAIASARAAIERYPRNNSGYETLALALLASGETDAALEASNAGIEVTADRPRLWVVRGQVLARLGRMDEARTSVEHALELAPAYDDARRVLLELASLDVHDVPADFQLPLCDEDAATTRAHEE